MNTIWKYVLKPEQVQDVIVPKDSKVISAINQHEDIVLYILTNPEEAEKEHHRVVVVGTGENFEFPWNLWNKPFNFVNTVSMSEGNLIFHVFESLDETKSVK